MLAKAVEKPFQAARIGRDEFMVLLPGTDERGGEAVMESIRQLLEVNNQFYSGMPFSFAMGAATANDGERLEPVLQRADAAMYVENARTTTASNSLTSAAGLATKATSLRRYSAKSADTPRRFPSCTPPDCSTAIC